MTEEIALKIQLRNLYQHISIQRRRQLLMLLILMILVSLAEILSIGAVIPFLAVLAAPEKLMLYPKVGSFLEGFGVMTPERVQLFLAIFFIGAVLLASVLRLTLSWTSIRLAYATGADLSHRIYLLTLCQPYAVHISRNSSQLISAIVSKVNIVISSVISPVLMLISSILLFFAISSVLFAINITTTLLSFLSFGVMYMGIVMASRTLRRRSGQTVASKSTQVIKALQEGLGGVRDILLDGNQKTYCDIYRAADVPMRRAQGTIQFLAQSPRFVFEAIGMVIVAIIALALSDEARGLNAAVPILGALAIGIQRLLPVMQHAYMSWSSLTSSQPILEEVLGLLEQSIPPEMLTQSVEPLPFDHSIRLRDVHFRYVNGGQKVLDGVNVVIEKGGHIGIIGVTGGGKSTLVDLIMGLLSPQLGSIEVDGVIIDETNLRRWQRRLAHVPQNIFLIDSTIAENIAFGVPRDLIDMARVQRSALQAQIATDIERWPAGYETLVGERGIRLSGGQRQRIGIARALYKDADVIVFDEATSALDAETEKAVMNAISALSPNLTTISIAHRVTTLERCTSIVEITQKGQLYIHSYSALCERLLTN